MNYITLEWKEFSIDLNRVRKHLKEMLSDNYDGLIADQYKLQVMFKADYSEEQGQLVVDYWNSIDEETFAEPEPLTPDQQVRQNMIFGQVLISEFSAEDEVNALTTEQTGELINVLAPVQLMLFTGAVATAHAFLSQADLSALLSQPLLDKYLAKMAAYING